MLNKGDAIRVAVYPLGRVNERFGQSPEDPPINAPKALGGRSSKPLAGFSVDQHFFVDFVIRNGDTKLLVEERHEGFSVLFVTEPEEVWLQSQTKSDKWRGGE